METKIAELCEIEVGLYLGYYNGEYKFSEFNQKLESNQKKIIDLVYDLLEEGYEDKEILPEIKSQCEFYKESPEWFGEDDDSSNYPSGYYESEKTKKYPFHEKCGYTLSLVKRFFKARKSVKAEISLRDELAEEDIRESIVYHMKAMKKKKKNKKNKSKSNRRKKSKRKNKKKSKR